MPQIKAIRLVLMHMEVPRAELALEASSLVQTDLPHSGSLHRDRKVEVETIRTHTMLIHGWNLPGTLQMLLRERLSWVFRVKT